ncbi:MAG: CoA pyrophosphatase [Tissierellia bacterium]|nr:CoA pyrophosphatase [Tissierellia bacterium]
MLEKIKNVISKNEPKFLGLKRETGILVPLMYVDGDINIIFQKRSANVAQPGDISFAGGHREDGETFAETAIRETHEEMGVDFEKIELIGKLSKAYFITGMYSESFVGFIHEDFENLRPDPKEVDHLIKIPLNELLKLNPDVFTSEVVAIKDESFPYYLIENGKDYPFYKGKDDNLFYNYDGTVIWGYTAKLLNLFLEIVREEV